MRGDEMHGRERPEVQSTTWDEIEAVVDDRGYRAGFVAVFLEFRGAILDDEPIDARGRPAVVNQSNFARHFGIAVSTFHRWLTEHGGPEFALEGERKEKAEAAKGRQQQKAQKKDRDAVAQQVRRKVAEAPQDFKDKAAVHAADLNLWCLDLHALAEFEDGPEKARLVDEYLDLLDDEVKALESMREGLLSWRTEWDATDGTAAA
jgi:hypothetical protein